jgi:hypothetical protein
MLTHLYLAVLKAIQFEEVAKQKTKIGIVAALISTHH